MVVFMDGVSVRECEYDERGRKLLFFCSVLFCLFVSWFFVTVSTAEHRITRKRLLDPPPPIESERELVASQFFGQARVNFFCTVKLR